jgi:hypothetical protein
MIGLLHTVRSAYTAIDVPKRYEASAWEKFLQIPFKSG